MIPGLANVFRIPDLRRKFLFTVGMLAVFRLGSHIPGARRERGPAAEPL